MSFSQLTLKCRLITPMFMAGADIREPELRPSEFKGMMRFWWRAIKAENDIETLKKEEIKIFGGTGENPQKSKVWLKIKEEISKKGKYFLLPHKKRANISCFLPDTTFEITLKIFKKDLKTQIASLIFLMFILGGFGKRSRRGFGSIELEDFKKLNINLEVVLKLLKKIQDTYEIKDNKIINLKNGGKYPWIKEIEIGKPVKNWEDLLLKIGEATHKYRDPSLGNGNPRMASPIYVSVIRTKEGYRPIVTTLNSRFPEKNYPRWNFEKQKLFKEEILL